MTQREIMGRKYDELYERVSKVFGKYNPCNIQDGVCARGRAGGRNFCCSDPRCEHLTSTGCGVKALYCRLWVCDKAEFEDEATLLAFKEEIAQIYSEASMFGFLGFRKSKEQVLAHIAEEVPVKTV